MRLENIARVTVGQIMTRVTADRDSGDNVVGTVNVLVPKAISSGVIVKEDLGDAELAKVIDKDKFTKLAHGPIANLYQDKATSYGIQVAFYKMALRNILPDELKDVNIDTCIIQVCSSGRIIRTKNNISLTDSELIKLLSWCIEEDDKAKGKTSKLTDVKMPNTSTFETSNFSSSFSNSEHFNNFLVSLLIRRPSLNSYPLK